MVAHNIWEKTLTRQIFYFKFWRNIQLITKTSKECFLLVLGSITRKGSIILLDYNHLLLFMLFLDIEPYIMNIKLPRIYLRFEQINFSEITC